MVRRLNNPSYSSKAPRKKRTPKEAGMNRDLLRVNQNAREQENHDRLERLLKQIVERAKDDEFGRIDAIMELEEARLMALSTFPPQITAAVQATKVKAEIMGLIIRKTKDMGGGPESLTGPTAEQEEAVYERIAERMGSRAADQFRVFVEKMRTAFRGGVIEGDPPEEIGE